MTTIAQNSIELWAIEAEKEFKRSKEPMTLEQSMKNTELSQNERYLEDFYELREALENGTYNTEYVCAFYNRVRSHHTYTVTIALALFVGSLACCPSDVVIYANYLQFQAFKFKQRLLDMRFFNTWCFSDGIPTSEAMKKVWEAQKIGTDNLLECTRGGESIAFPKL